LKAPENACANMVMMGLKGYSTRFDERKTLAWVYQRHSAGLKVDRPNLQDTILKVVDQSKAILEAYRQMAKEKLNEDIAKRIAESELPLRTLPDFIQVDTLDDKRVLSKFDPRHTVWDTYNSVTAAIWHNAKSDIDTKINQFNQLHAVIPIAR